jgi:hypothetical protein
MASDKPIKALTQLAPYEGKLDVKRRHRRQGMGMKAVEGGGCRAGLVVASTHALSGLA